MKLPKPVKRTNCDDCTAHCCRYVIVEIDKPVTWYDFHNIRWFVAHKDVSILKDRNKWYVKYATDCEYLDEHSRCKMYDKRPVMCRRHEIETCEMSGYEDEHDTEFRGIDEFDKWLEEKKMKAKKGKKGKRIKKK